MRIVHGGPGGTVHLPDVVTAVGMPKCPRKQIEVGVLPHVIGVGRTQVIGVETNKDIANFRVVNYSPLAAVGEAVKESVFIAGQTGEFLGRLARGREDKCQLGGPLKIASMAGKAAERGWSWLIQLVALLSIGIGILNLLPIPPLDGGHLLFYAIEGVTRRPTPEKLQEIVYRAGGVMILAFMLFVIFNDFFSC